MNLTIAERMELINELTRTFESVFDILLLALVSERLHSHFISSNYASQQSRVIQLVNWAESHQGCGLEIVKYYLDCINNDIKVKETDLTTLRQRNIESRNLSFHSSVPLIEVQREGRVVRGIHIQAGSKRIVLEEELPKPAKDIKKKIRQNYHYAAVWKRVHTLTEDIYPLYTKLLRYMRLAQLSYGYTSQQAIYNYSSYFNDTVWQKSQTFGLELQRLDLIKRTKFIQVLSDIPLCLPAIRRSIDFPPNSIEFDDCISLVERLGELVLNGLHIADKILELHFENLIAG